MLHTDTLLIAAVVYTHTSHRLNFPLDSQCSKCRLITIKKNIVTFFNFAIFLQVLLRASHWNNAWITPTLTLTLTLTLTSHHRQHHDCHLLLEQLLLVDALAKTVMRRWCEMVGMKGNRCLLSSSLTLLLLLSLTLRGWNKHHDYHTIQCYHHCWDAFDSIAKYLFLMFFLLSFSFHLLVTSTIWMSMWKEVGQ